MPIIYKALGLNLSVIKIYFKGFFHEERSELGGGRGYVHQSVSVSPRLGPRDRSSSLWTNLTGPEDTHRSEFLSQAHAGVMLWDSKGSQVSAGDTFVPQSGLLEEQGHQHSP